MFIWLMSKPVFGAWSYNVVLHFRDISAIHGVWYLYRASIYGAVFRRPLSSRTSQEETSRRFVAVHGAYPQFHTYLHYPAPCRVILFRNHDYIPVECCIAIRWYRNVRIVNHLYRDVRNVNCGYQTPRRNFPLLPEATVSAWFHLRYANHVTTARSLGSR